MKAELNNYRQAPRKVRLVADLVRGQKVPVALAQLQFLPKRAAAPVAKLINSAVANALQLTPGATPENFKIKTISVNGGQTLKRMMPRARGSGNRINKRTSRLALTLVHES
jgi:large subunit ribosomal protein L22